jgi:integrase
MIATMPRPRPPYLHRERTRHGHVIWYVRVGKGPRIRVHGEFGSSEFNAAYRAAIAGKTTPQGSPRTVLGSLAWLIGRYRDSASWARLSTATRSQRDGFYRKICETAGDAQYSKITKKTIIAGRDRRKATPFAANDFLKAMRSLFKWAKDSDFITVDPTEGIEGFGHKTEGFHVWTDDEIANFEVRWPIGTRERLALTILLYTGLRRGDAARLGRQHVRDGVITFRTEKTGQQVVIPMLPELAEIIAATKTGDLAFVATPTGGPMTKESFGNWFRLACKAAGVPGAAHGLRKAGATRAANNGATEAELEAIFGWHGGRMASLYTRQADRVRLARHAMGKLSRATIGDEKATSIPAPTDQVRAPGLKT